MTAENLTEYVEETVRNPLAIFRLIYRASSFLRNLRRKENETTWLDLPLEKVDSNLRQELVDASDAIMNIHFMYNLSASDVMTPISISTILFRKFNLISAILDGSRESQRSTDGREASCVALSIHRAYC